MCREGNRIAMVAGLAQLGPDTPNSATLSLFLSGKFNAEF